jgi:glycosyltransferase involved in cell wall biosynthesis
MHTKKLIKVLLIPDKMWGADSGAISARYTVEVLKDLNYHVGVYAFPEGGNELDQENCGLSNFYPRRPFSSINHFYGGEVKKEFERVLTDFQPDYVFFAGIALNKPLPFFKTCFDRDIPILLLFYINDYYCCRIYAALPNGPCFKCIRGNYLYALWNGCETRRPRCVYLIKDIAVHVKLKPALLRCYKAFGYSNDQISIYRRYGISSDKCIRCPIFFDKRTIQGVESKLGDYFILCGQSRMEKGWHIISDVVSLCPSVRFKFLFINMAAAKDSVEKFKLKKFINTGQVEVITDVSEHSELLSMLAASRGVLIPSYYPTTGEFVLLESLGLAKPVIVFDTGIHREVIRSGENGMMVKVGDTEAYAAAIRTLSEDKDVYNRISLGARRLFDELTSVEGLRKALQEAMSLS